MYSNVVVGVDGRSGGRDAAALAASLTSADAHFAIVHVCIVDPLPTHASISTFELANSERAVELLQTERDLCGHATDAIRVTAKSVGAGLDEIAEERKADLIVVGSCHRHLVGRVVTGDDAASVLHHAHCAVAVAPAGYAGKARKVKRVGLAYDGTPEAKLALAHAGRLAAGLDARVVARHFAVPHVYASTRGLAGAYVEDPEDVLTAARKRLGDLGDVQLEVVVGSIDPGLAAFSDEVDLLVCGSRHNGAVRRVVLGSTSDYLAHHAHSPLLVTPTSAAATVAQCDEAQNVVAA